MYEVFVDNKKIVFTDSSQNLNHEQCVMEEFDMLPFLSYADFIEKLPVSKQIFIVCASAERSWKNFVCNFNFIDAAGGIVTFENYFLAIFRNNFWDLPKGKLEKNEDPIQGAKREIEEECGILDLHFVKSICNTFHTYEMNNHLFIKRTFWYHFECNEKQQLTPQVEEGITRADWLTIHDKKLFLDQTFESIKEVVASFGYHTAHL